MNKRRGFIKRAGMASIAAISGLDVVFADNLPEGMSIVGLQDDLPWGKDSEMTLLNDLPWNIEAKAHLLDDAVTPADKFFVRNNGLVPENPDAATWSLRIEGESAENVKTYTIKELREKFNTYSYNLVIECGGNGRSEFNPPAKGNQWTIGAVACAKWTGVRLKDVLNDVGLKNDAVYIGYYGADIHLSKDPSKIVISRGVPISKALEDETLIAWEMNDQQIPILNGYPLRLVMGGWPGSVSGKWLNRIIIRNKVHDGEKMGGDSYRMPCDAVAPGAKVADEDMCIIESMPVKSLITSPKSGAMIDRGKSLKVSGHAWAGDYKVSEVHVSINFGSTWQNCSLDRPVNRLAWQRWTTQVSFPKTGYYEVWARAADEQGNAQPMVVPGWNPKGYLNNACHRIAVQVS
ncbi:MAG: sulfite oxidase [Bacteroidetes bacterium]|nr:sulfite oxidase [Bacteroidota bacterium]